MKNVFLRDVTARDIDEQVEKIIRDLGSPDPPLNLDDVRVLLKLDRQYYSSTEDGALREVVHRLTIGGKQVLARPALLLDAIKKWDLRALFLPDKKRILIDSTLPIPKHRWSEAHEIAHSIIPWHDGTMLGDNKQTLTPSCHEQIENEANYAAGQLLFLRNQFVADARSSPPTVEAIARLRKRYGNTITTTLWRYVEQSEEPTIGCISCHPCRVPQDFNPDLPFRYFVTSKDFCKRFSSVQEKEIFDSIKGYCKDRKGGPLGSSEITIKDDADESHVFHFETFFNRYEALTLGVYRHSKKLIVPAGIAGS